MFTASDVRKRLKEINRCEGIDEWIESVLVPKFATSNDIVVIIDRTVKWDSRSFVACMHQRGFVVGFYCEDLCGQRYYKITLPPGDE